MDNNLSSVMETKNTGRKLQWLPVVIALVQVADIVIYVGSNMIEPIRIASNLFILVRNTS